MINPMTVKIGTILNSSQQFEVPRYQREFEWGKNEALDFMEDLKSYAEFGGGNLFLGTLIFQNPEKPRNTVRIVDGQQRITTILILLTACKELAKKLNATNLVPVIQSKITFVDDTTGESQGCRLVASDSIRDVFEIISKNDWDGVFPSRVGKRQVKRQVNKIKPIYDFFAGEIKGFDQSKLSGFLKVLYDSYAVQIEIHDETEAFSIFERTNARGLELEVSDLLKNYLFQSGVTDLEESWAQIALNSNGTLLRMLKYFYVSQKGAVAKSDLYKNLRKLRKDGSEVGAAQLVRDLEEFSRFYCALRTGDRNSIRDYFESIHCTAVSEDEVRYGAIYIALEGLRLFNVSQPYPLIYSAIQCYMKKGGVDRSRSKKLVALFEALESYHFINNAVCERIGNEVEKLYADYCLTYASSDDFEGVTSTLITSLKGLLASVKEFSSRFSELTYDASTIPLLAYIFDRINNKGLDPGQRVTIFNSNQRVLRKSHNIEHFLARNAEGKSEDQKWFDVVNNIGNLLAISFRTNSRLGNVTPSEKIAKLKGPLFREIQNQAYVRDFIETYEKETAQWNEDAIAKRAQDLAQAAYNSVWKIN